MQNGIIIEKINGGYLLTASNGERYIATSIFSTTIDDIFRDMERPKDPVKCEGVKADD